MKLYICEKPSQARDIAAVLGAPKGQKSHIETSQGVVTWGYGHLLEMLRPDQYRPEWAGRWSWEQLPIMPDQFRFTPKDAARSQLEAIGRLLKEASEVVVATDADREGEMIAREILAHFRYRGPVRRLWLSALDPASVRKALGQLKEGRETEPLYHAALARSQADWLVGMNMSRAFTIRGMEPGQKGWIAIGRVQTPTLALVVRRDREIEGFRPRDYFEVLVDTRSAGGETVVLRHAPRDEDRIFDRAVADRIAAAAKGYEGPYAVETSRKTKAPPKLFSLSGLQKRANALWGWGADKTLTVAQSLYETHKVTTYPRTDCEYLPEEQKGDVPAILKHVLSLPGMGFPSAKDLLQGQVLVRGSVFNTSNVTAHHAIIPTLQAADLDKLSADERKAYMLICKHYVAMLLPDYEYQHTKISMTAGVEFSATGHVPQKAGWKEVFGGEEEVDPREEGEETLPPILDGEPGRVEDATVDGKQTQPPKHYTEGTLIDDMKNIAKYVTDPAKKAMLKETSGLGTEATRAETIAKLKRDDNIEVKGKKILSTPKGRMIVELCEKHIPSLVDPGETAVWEQSLEAVAEGAAAHVGFVESIKVKIVEQLGSFDKVMPQRQPVPASQAGEVLTVEGVKCPRSGQPVQDCGRHYRFPGFPEVYCNKVVSGRTMKPEEYVDILSSKDGVRFEGFVSTRTNKPFGAVLRYKPRAKYKIAFDFD